MLPNWKEPKEYAFFKKLPNEGCAWEFLRRNQDHFEEYTSLVAHVNLPYESPLSPKFDPQAAKYVPPRKVGESYQQWRLRAVAEGHEPRTYSEAQLLAMKWGLLEPADPDKDATQQVVRFKPLEPYPLQPYWDQLSQYFEDEGTGPPRPPYLTLVFDLRYSRDEQLKRARKQLAERFKVWKSHVVVAEKVHPAPGMLIKYLRVLDAYRTEKKITAKQVAAVLYKKPNTIKPHKPSKHEISSIYYFRKRALYLTTKEGYEAILRSRGRSSKKSAK
jgi:hypothetical protein